MKITVMVFVTMSPTGEVTGIEAYSQGITYAPDMLSKVNDQYRAIFSIEGDEDRTPALTFVVSDGVGVGERLG